MSTMEYVHVPEYPQSSHLGINKVFRADHALPALRNELHEGFLPLEALPSHVYPVGNHGSIYSVPLSMAQANVEFSGP